MIDQIRRFLSDQKLDAVLVTRTDCFLGEYYPPEHRQLSQATGFSGSAGLAVVTQDQKVLFVDSRYTEQAKIESDYQVFEVPRDTTPSDWIIKNLKGKKIGYNPWQRSAQWVALMKQKEIDLQEIAWQKWQELFPQEKSKKPKVFRYDTTYCGETTRAKIQRVVKVLKKKELDAYVFTVPDSVSYILNKRSSAVSDYPVVFERLIVFNDGTYRELPADVSVLKNKAIGLDFALTPMGVYKKLKQVAKIVDCEDPAEKMKSVKNAVEQNNIRQATLFESKVICRFLAFVEQNKERLDELSCDQKLKELRSESPLYRGDSFDTIAAVGEHAARPHYKATPQSNKSVSEAPLLLVDTGGNYLNGTTDMTRTICIRNPTDEMKKRYTQVLKGHIALAMTAVQEGDLPTQLDQNARQFLRADGVDYGHSTGHGIGMYLAVHETPPTIHEKSPTPLKAGMLFSNEPAYYKAGEYGIRLENMILTVAGPGNTLILENLLWIPFDSRLVITEMLTEGEKEWLRSYHRGILDRIYPDLSAEEQEAIKPLLDFFMFL